MGQDNHDMSGLTDISKRPDHKELAAKGGKNSSSSEWWKKKAFIEKLKKGSLTDTDLEWALQRATNSQAFALDLLTDVDKMSGDVHPMQRISWINAKTQIMKMIHGEKMRTENVNININTTTEEMERRLMGEEVEEGE